MTPGLPRLCSFSLSLLSLSLSVNFLNITHSRLSAHKQSSQVLSLSSRLTLLTNSLPTLSFRETSFSKDYLHPSSHVLPFCSFLSCMLPILSSLLDLPSCLILLFVLYSPHSLSCSYFIFHSHYSSLSSLQQLRVVERPWSSM